MKWSKELIEDALKNSGLDESALESAIRAIEDLEDQLKEQRDAYNFTIFTEKKQGSNLRSFVANEDNALSISGIPSPGTSMLRAITRPLILDHIGDKSFSSNIIKKLTQESGLPLKFLAERVFEVTPKTLRKYKTGDSNLPPTLLELAVKLEKLFGLGLEIFGSKKEFVGWLNQESFGLGGIIPAEILNTSTGVDMVFEELKRIEFGVTI